MPIVLDFPTVIRLAKFNRAATVRLRESDSPQRRRSDYKQSSRRAINLRRLDRGEAIDECSVAKGAGAAGTLVSCAVKSSMDLGRHPDDPPKARDRSGY
jgi:hypothetical protein